MNGNTCCGSEGRFPACSLACSIVPTRPATVAFIREAVAATWPHRFAPGELRDDVSLGEEGLGLDSVELVQVILACEERCGRQATESLFDRVPLTIELLARYFAAA